MSGEKDSFQTQLLIIIAGGISMLCLENSMISLSLSKILIKRKETNSSYSDSESIHHSSPSIKDR